MGKPTALGANIFAGGFSLGVSKHFKLLGHLEHDDGYGAQVSSKNLGIPIYVGTDQWPEKVKHLDFLYSNPPCAIWSTASGRPGHLWDKDPRLQRIRDIFALVDRYKPYVWCWESVCQAFNRGRPFVEELAKEANKRGYSASYVLIDAAYLGTPQHRKRFFLVLHRVKINWEKAKPDFTKIITAGQALKGVKPVKELIGKMTPGELKVLRHVKPGEKLNHVFNRITKKPKIGDRGQVLGRPSFLKRRLDPKIPSSTVIGNAIFHPTQDRFLSVNETAALCGFPQTWQWPRSDGYNLLARGVMPPVGEWLARQVAAAIKKKQSVGKPTKFLVDFRAAPGLIYEHGIDDKEGSGKRVWPRVNLDWKPGDVSTHYQDNVSAHQHKASGQGRARREEGGPRPSGTGRPADGEPRAERRALEVGQLAEATRRGIPDKDSQVLIRQALAKLRHGIIPASSGMLIRARLLEGKAGDQQIVEEVLKKFQGRKTTTADVGYHRYKMRRVGMI